MVARFVFLTFDCARQAIALGIPTYLCDDETATPRRLR